MKKIFIIVLLLPFILQSSFSTGKDAPLHFNPWELIIYRPENTKDLNVIRCWIKIEDEEGNDITYDTSKIKATYEWVSIPNKANYYRKKIFLSGGMACHLNIALKGKYKISVYTPKDQQMGFICENHEDWESNVYIHNTENPAKAIFVYPTANENGFYTGGWHVDIKAPEFWKVTKPFRKN